MLGVGVNLDVGFATADDVAPFGEMSVASAVKVAATAVSTRSSLLVCSGKAHAHAAMIIAEAINSMRN